jgi:hypothetical protein
LQVDRPVLAALVRARLGGELARVDAVAAEAHRRRVVGARRDQIEARAVGPAAQDVEAVAGAEVGEAVAAADVGDAHLAGVAAGADVDPRRAVVGALLVGVLGAALRARRAQRARRGVAAARGDARQREQQEEGGGAGHGKNT